MKKFFIGFVIVVVLAIVAIERDAPPTRLFGGKLIEFISPLFTSKMFISEDTDDFDPGLLVGAQFPPIRAQYQGEEVTHIDRFVQDRGAVFIAVRSVDW